MRGRNKSEVMDINVLERIKDYIPGEEETMLSKVFLYLQKLSENSNDDKVWNEMEQYIDSRLDRITDIIEEYNQKEVPRGVEDIHLKVLDGFIMLYEGLFGIKEFVFHEDSQLVLKAFEIMADGDQLLMEVEESTEDHVESTTISAII